MNQRLLTVLAIALAVTSQVRAEDAPAVGAVENLTVQAATAVSSAPPGYGEAIEAALREHELGNYQEARVHFLRAHELFPNARTLRGLGKVEFELRNYGDSARYLEQALASDVKPLDATLRDETERLLVRARVYVGEVHVDVEPGSATVSVDGVTVASGPKASISLVVGDHLLEFQAHGRVPQRRVIRVRGGEQTVIQVVLPTPEPAHGQDVARRDETPLRKKWWVWTAAGAVLASVAVGIAVASTRHDTKTRPATGGSSGTIVEGL